MREISPENLTLSAALLSRWQRETQSWLFTMRSLKIDVSRARDSYRVLDDGRLQLIVEPGTPFSLILHADPGEWSEAWN